MKFTKYEHACFTIEKDGKRLVVDPGNLTDDIGSPKNVVAIVVTHEHSDHFDLTNIENLASQSSDIIVYGPKEVIGQLNSNIAGQVVEPGDVVNHGPFKLEFFGGTHQKPFRDSPTVANVAVLINNTVYHASDSFVNPSKLVDTLLLPVSGSWMSSQMARDYLYDIKPRLVIPSHDAILSEKGKRQVDKYWPIHCEKIGCTYLRTNEPIEI